MSLRAVILLLLTCLPVGLWANPQEMDYSEATEVMSPEELQGLLMNYASNYNALLSETVDKMVAEEPDVKKRLALETFALDSATNSLLIASNSNPYIGMVDLLVMVSLQYQVTEDYWMKEGWGPGAAPMLEVIRWAREETWKTARTMLNAQQEADVREIIKRVRANYPDLVNVSWIRPAALAAYRQQMFYDEEEGGSLLSFLALDPMENLTPATRELARSRMLAAQSLFYFERLPSLLEGHIDLMMMRAASMPEAQRALVSLEEMVKLSADATALASDIRDDFKAERVVIMNQLSQERKVAIEQFFERLKEEREAILLEMESLETRVQPMMDQSLSNAVRLGAKEAEALLDKAFLRALLLIAAASAGLLVALTVPALILFKRKNLATQGEA